VSPWRGEPPNREIAIAIDEADDMTSIVDSVTAGFHAACMLGLLRGRRRSSSRHFGDRKGIVQPEVQLCVIAKDGKASKRAL
jgi:hypothetical protein